MSKQRCLFTLSFFGDVGPDGKIRISIKLDELGRNNVFMCRMSQHRLVDSLVFGVMCSEASYFLIVHICVEGLEVHGVWLHHVPLASNVHQGPL